MKRLALALAVVVLALVAGCRLGGPSADPNEFIGPETESSMPDGQAVDSAVPPANDAPAHEAGSVSDASGDTNHDAGANADAQDAAADATSDGDGCSPPVNPLSCDPVGGAGCPVLQQCDIDTTVLPAATGHCVFTTMDDAGTCNFTILSESCPSQSTCVAGACKRICYCNADCSAGECCGGTPPGAGFNYCTPCP